MGGIKRVNVQEFREKIAAMSEAESETQWRLDEERAAAEHAAFTAHYKRQVCYLCGKPFRTISKDKPCVHWLLRQAKFKKKDFPLVYERFGYTQIAAFVRWCANQEYFMRNINDLDSGRSPRKVFEYTVRWKNIEWTFDCGHGDYEGHSGTHASFPHYHFQMRIDGRPFIDYGDFHIPLQEEDLFHLDLTQNAGDIFRHSFGEGGAGMQAAAEIGEVAPEILLDESVVAKDENSGTLHMSTIITSTDGPVDMKAFIAMFKESERTGQTVASLARKYMPKGTVKTIISPAENIPPISKRTERSRR